MGPSREDPTVPGVSAGSQQPLPPASAQGVSPPRAGCQGEQAPPSHSPVEAGSPHLLWLPCWSRQEGNKSEWKPCPTPPFGRKISEQVKAGDDSDPGRTKCVSLFSLVLSTYHPPCLQVVNKIHGIMSWECVLLTAVHG